MVLRRSGPATRRVVSTTAAIVLLATGLVAQSIGSARPAAAETAACWLTSLAMSSAETGAPLNPSMVPGEILEPGAHVRVQIGIDPTGPRGCNGELEARVMPGDIPLDAPFSFNDSIDYEFVVPGGLASGVDYTLRITTPSSFFHPDIPVFPIATIGFRMETIETGGAVPIPDPVPAPVTAPDAPEPGQDAATAPVEQAPAVDAAANDTVPPPPPAEPAPPAAEGAPDPTVATAAAERQATLPVWVWSVMLGVVAAAALAAVVGRIAFLRRRRIRDARLAQHG